MLRLVAWCGCLGLVAACVPASGAHLHSKRPRGGVIALTGDYLAAMKKARTLMHLHCKGDYQVGRTTTHSATADPRLGVPVGGLNQQNETRTSQSRTFVEFTCSGNRAP